MVSILYFLSFELNGVEISIAEDNKELSSLKEKYAFSTDLGYLVYAIKTSDDKRFYVNGGVFGVFTNEFDILQSSVGDFTWSEGNKLIFWSADK